MTLFYFFTKDENSKLTWGEEYFVMSDSLNEAMEAVKNCDNWKRRDYSDMDEMGVIEVGKNKVIQTEIS